MTNTRTSALAQASLIGFLAVALYTMTPSIAYAVSTPMGGVLCMILSFIYGNLGRALCVLAIIMVGIGAMLGKVSWGLALTVAIGISVVSGANTIGCLLIFGNLTGCVICP